MHKHSDTARIKDLLHYYPIAIHIGIFDPQHSFRYLYVYTVYIGINEVCTVMKASKSQSGFTLIELMLTVAIIGILASVALPSYALYRNKARFGEAILAIGSYRSAIITAASVGRATAVTDFDSGALGIPATVVAAANTHGVNVVDGAITITWRSDGTDLAGTTYTLTAQGYLPPIQWASSGSCVDAGYC